jgi:RNA polymerase sigma-70 factor (ECF subfamily)
LDDIDQVFRVFDRLQNNSAFQSTQWSMVLRASDLAASEEGKLAMQQLCETYWYPLYAYVRRRIGDPEEAKDVTQGFFTQLISSSGVASVHPEKGRFRAFLLASVKNYLQNYWRDGRTIKSGGNVNLIPIDDPDFERRYQRELSSDERPELLFERDWAVSLLQRAVAQLREDYAAAGRLELFEAMHPYLVASGDQIPQAEIADRFGMSVSGVKMSVYRLREQYAKRVRAEVSATLASPTDVDDELRQMISLFHRR